MIVGIVWPMPFKDARPELDPSILEALKETKATHIRINLDHRHAEAERVLTQIRGAGFEVLPILDLDYQKPNIPAYLDFCERIVGTHGFPMVELLNEPKTMEKMSSATYCRVVEAVGERLQRFRPQTRLLIAGDFLKFDRSGPKTDNWLKDVKPKNPALFDAVAIHPYREPGKPSVTRFGTRPKEYDHCKSHFYSLPLVVTEVGWNLREVSEQQQADYTYEELRINRAYGIEATYIYAHISEMASGFGVLRQDNTARPVVARIAQFQDEQAT